MLFACCRKKKKEDKKIPDDDFDSVEALKTAPEVYPIPYGGDSNERHDDPSLYSEPEQPFHDPALEAEREEAAAAAAATAAAADEAQAEFLRASEAVARAFDEGRADSGEAAVAEARCGAAQEERDHAYEMAGAAAARLADVEERIAEAQRRRRQQPERPPLQPQQSYLGAPAVVVPAANIILPPGHIQRPIKSPRRGGVDQPDFDGPVPLVTAPAEPAPRFKPYDPPWRPRVARESRTKRRGASGAGEGDEGDTESRAPGGLLRPGEGAIIPFWDGRGEPPPGYPLDASGYPLLDEYGNPLRDPRAQPPQQEQQKPKQERERDDKGPGGKELAPPYANGGRGIEPRGPPAPEDRLPKLPAGGPFPALQPKYLRDLGFTALERTDGLTVFVSPIYDMVRARGERASLLCGVFLFSALHLVTAWVCFEPRCEATNPALRSSHVSTPPSSLSQNGTPRATATHRDLKQPGDPEPEPEEPEEERFIWAPEPEAAAPVRHADFPEPYDGYAPRPVVDTEGKRRVPRMPDGETPEGAAELRAMGFVPIDRTDGTIVWASPVFKAVSARRLFFLPASRLRFCPPVVLSE